MEPADDRPLLDRIRRGDACAFEDLYRRYASRVRLVAWRLSRRAEWLDDLTSEAWLRAFACRSSYDPARPFLTWVCGILQNCWREQLRSDKKAVREKGGLSAHELQSAPSESETLEEAIAEAELLSGLNECIRQLGQADQDIIRWRFFEGQSLRAVAQRLAIPEATLRESRLPAIIGRLERCLGGKGLAHLFEKTSAQSMPSIQDLSGDSP